MWDLYFLVYHLKRGPVILREADLLSVTSTDTCKAARQVIADHVDEGISHDWGVGEGKILLVTVNHLPVYGRVRNRWRNV